jgi:hypothetical protein
MRDSCNLRHIVSDANANTAVHPRWSAYYITLEDRPDRAKNFEAWAKTPGSPWSSLTCDVKAFTARRHPRGGDFGCWQSHVSVMKLAVDDGADYALVFEDDAIPTKEARSQLTWDLLYAQVMHVMSTRPNWDIIGLGGIPLTWWHTALKIDTHMVQTPFLEAHAYFASKKFMSRMLATEFTGTFDSELARRSAPECYIVAHELFEQDPNCGSNLSLSSIIPFRRIYKRAAWAWTRRFEHPCRNVVVLMTASTVALLAAPYVREALSRRPWAKWTSRGIVLLLASVYIINEYGQDCHSSRYRR